MACGLAIVLFALIFKHNYLFALILSQNLTFYACTLYYRSTDLSVQISPEDAAQAACRTILETMLLGLTSFDEANPGHIQIIEEVQ